MLFLCVLGVLCGENRFDRVYNIFSTSTKFVKIRGKNLPTRVKRAPSESSKTAKQESVKIRSIR